MAEITLRAPCARCGSVAGTVRQNGPHQEALCAGCGRHCYFVPKPKTPPEGSRDGTPEELTALSMLRAYCDFEKLSGADAVFALSLADQYRQKNYLSDKQWPWVLGLAAKGAAL